MTEVRHSYRAYGTSVIGWDELAVMSKRFTEL